jgi:ribonuclease BN (tRNA processing enzyme)
VLNKSPSTVEICVIGSGTGIPSRRRRPPALVVRVKGYTLLFDCGAGTIWSLAEAGLDYRDLDSIWFTHFHPDHTAGLVPLLFAARSPDYGRKKPLLVGGATGLKDFFRRLHGVYGSWIELDPALLTFEEIEHTDSTEMELSFGKLFTLQMDHTKESLGYRLETKDGFVISYSGDTEYCSNAVTLAREADLFFCECSFPDNLEVKGHLTPQWAGRVAQEAACKRLVLIHLYPMCDEIDVVAACGKEYSGEIVLAEDFMWFRL